MFMLGCVALSVGIGTLAQASPVPGKAEAVLAQSAAANKYTFIFFYRDGPPPSAILAGQANTSETQRLRAVFDGAMQKIAARAVPVAVNVADAGETTVVQRFRVAQSPMPLVMAVAPSGATTRTFLRNFTEQGLLSAFASPAMEKCLKSFQDRKLVLLCAQNARTSANEAAMKGVTDFKADPRFGKIAEVVVVTVDPSDSAESQLLGRYKIDPKTTEAVTLLLAPPGAVLATYTGATSKDAMVAKLTASLAGCGSGCRPGACKPAKPANVAALQKPTLAIRPVSPPVPGKP